MNKSVCLFFSKHLQPWSAEFLKILNIVLETGWLYLHKREYNLIVILKKLCGKIILTHFTLFNYKDKKVIDRLHSLETQFLILHFHPDYPDIIISSLHTVLDKDPDHKEFLQNAEDLAKKILYKDATIPSFYNFILGLNIFKYRRYLNLRDLIQDNQWDVISSIYFECEPEIQKKIDEYIQECKQNLIPFYKRKQEILRMKSFLSRDNDGGIDFRPLQYFYESSRSKNTYNFSKDKENIILIISRFFTIFAASFEFLLNDKVHIAGTGELRIFSRNFFQLECSRIQYLVGKLEKISFGFPFPESFSWERYLLLNNSNRDASETEAEVMTLISEGLNFLHGIGKKLAYVLSMRQPKENDEEEPDPIETIVLRGKPFSLPYEDKIIESKTYLGEKTILEGVSLIASICFLACLFFHDQYTSTLLAKEKSVDKEIKTKLGMLERIATPGVYQELKNMFS
ncbi:hypothetical protein ES703_104216 [subsurface metagenome]